jgi:hypothetical protein
MVTGLQQASGSQIRSYLLTFGFTRPSAMYFAARQVTGTVLVMSIRSNARSRLSMLLRDYLSL